MLVDTHCHIYEEYYENIDDLMKVLKDNNILDHYNIAKEDYEVVYKSIKNHNKLPSFANKTQKKSNLEI